MSSHEAWLFRSDAVLSNFMIKRYTKVDNQKIAFYRNASDAAPEFNLKIDKYTTPGKIFEGLYDVKPPGTSRVVALLRQSTTKETLVRHSITSKSNASGTTHTQISFFWGHCHHVRCSKAVVATTKS